MTEENIGSTQLKMNDSIDFNPERPGSIVTSTPKPTEGSRRKSNRRSWFEKPSGIKYSIAVENHEKHVAKSRKSDTEMETLVLTHFTNPPKIGFGTCKVGDSKHRTLLVKNPHEYAQNVKIERYPHKKNFSVESKEFDVEGDSVYYLDISWNPENEGNFREMIQFSVDSSYRLQAFVFGTCQNPQQKKKTGGKGLLSRRVKKPLSVVYTQSLANIAKSYSPEKSGISTDTVKIKCVTEKENRPELSEETLVSKDVKKKEKYHRRSNTYSASGQSDVKPDTPEQLHQEVNLSEGNSMAETKENQTSVENDSNNTPQTSHVSDESSEQRTIIERSQTKVISPDTFVQESTMERRTKEESVLSENLSKTPLSVTDAYAKNYVSPNSFLKDLNDTIENVPVGLDQSNSNSPENVLNESVPHNIMLSQLEFVKSNLKWNVSNNGESFTGKHTSVKELTSNCIGSISSNPFSVVPEGTSPRRTTYTVKRQRPSGKAISRAAPKVAGCKTSADSKSGSSQERSGIQKLGNRKPMKRRASGSMTPSSIRKSIADQKGQNRGENNAWANTFMTEPTPEKMALGKHLLEIPNSICLTPEILQESKNQESAWSEKGHQMLELPTPERMLLETYRGDKAPRTPLSHHYCDLVLPTPEKNLHKPDTSAGIGKTTSKLTFCHASTSKVEFSPKHMPNTCSPLLNDITHVAASTTVSKNPTELTSSQVVSSTITKEKPTILTPSAERKPFTCLFTPSKDRDEGQSDSSCSENSFPCTPLPTSPNPDLSRRSTHVVENPRIIDGSLLERKRLFPPLDDEEQENKENIPLIQSPCVSAWDKTESGERIKNIDVGSEDKVIPIGYMPSEEHSEKDRSSEVKAESNVEEKVSPCRKVDSFACFVPTEDQTSDHNRKEETKHLVEVPKTKPVRLKSSNLSEKSTKGLVAHKRKADEAGIQQQKSKAPVQRPNSKPKTAGIAKSKLILLKKSKTALPKHPMPFASKNIYYDERWMEKQERGFSQWLNFILTPSEDMGNNIKSKVDAAKLCSNKMGPQKLAPTKEALSFKEYSAGRKLNGLRRSACKLFQSTLVVTVVQKVEVEVESQRLMIRKDRKVHADLGLKQAVLDLLMSFNPLWLRIGLETVFGEIIGVHSNSDVVGLSHFIVTRLLSNPDIAAQYAHPSVPHLYSEGFSEAIAQHLLKKFLLLVYFLDYAKCQHMIKHDPCLFCKDSEYKSCKALVAEFSRQFLAGEGDINRHLGYLGYITKHSQTALDEFDYAVKNLSTDLKDGLRLTRILDLLEENVAMKRNLRVPAISRLQKIHNMDIAFTILKDIGIDVEKDAKKVTSRDIVDGHREKTLHLLWTIILKYQIGLLLSVDQLKDEISILERSLQVRNQLQALRNYEQGLQQNRRDSLYDDIYANNELVSLLLKWCRVVCLFYGVKVENFTVSFSDGRALCFLVHHYHPTLLPESLIHTRTTMTYQEEMESLDCSLSDSPAPVSVSADQDVYNDLLKNERENFKVLYQKLTELGGVPLMIRAADMCNTIPDEKVVLTYTSYLCARLLNIRQETRAARTIQLAWRKHILHKNRGKIKLKIKAAIKIQRFVRSWLQRLHVKKQESSAIIIQKYARGFLARKRTMQLQKEKKKKAAKVVLQCLMAHRERQRFIRMKGCAIKIQSVVRGFLVRKQVAKEQTAARRIQNWYLSSKESIKIRKEFLITKQCAITIQKGVRNFIQKRRSEKEMAALVLQTTWRAFCTRRWYKELQSSTIVIQRAVRTWKQRREFVRKREAVMILQQNYRCYQVTKQCRSNFLQIRSSCIVIQNAWRRRMEIRNQAAVTVQRNWRQFVALRKYQAIKKATVTIQSAFRAVSARKQFLKKKLAVLKIQKRYREILEGKKSRKVFLAQKSAATIVQTSYRAHRIRKQFLKTKSAVIVLQTALRKQIARKAYIQKRDSAIKIQRKLQATLKMRQDYNGYQSMRQAALRIQANFRGHVVRKAVRAAKEQEKAANEAAVILQCHWRQILAQRKYRAMKKATITIQAAFRTVSARKQFLEKKIAVLKIQKRCTEILKGREVRKQFLTKKSAATAIQATYRAHRVREQFLKTKSAVIVLQTALRKQIARKAYTQKRKSAVKIQTKLRATLKMRQDYDRYQSMKQAALRIQANFRGHVVRKAVRAVKQQEKAASEAAVTLQCQWRQILAQRKYRVMKEATITIQAAFRAVSARKQFFKKKTAVFKIQKRYREILEGRKVRKLFLTKKSAATAIQATYRAHRVREQFLKTKSAVIVLQTALRKQIARKAYTQNRKSALKIQRKFRATLKMRQDYDRYQSMKQAALRIQANFRGHMVRKAVRAVKQQEKAAKMIQKTWRCYVMRRKYLVQKNSAKTIQKAYRSWKQKEQEKLRNHAAVILQRRYRALKCMRLSKKSYLRIKSACCFIQQTWRKRVEMRNSAALRIQSYWRSYAAQRKYKETQRQVIMLQAVVRSWRTRKNYLQRKKSALVIQQWYRAHQRGIDQRNSFLVTKGAILTIQAVYRGYKQRMHFRKLRHYVTKIQAVYRGRKERREYVKKRRAAVTIQNRLRESLKARHQRRQFLMQKMAAIKIQAQCRAYMVRNQFKKVQNAVIRIQSATRTYLQRKQFQDIRGNVCKIQRKWRATLSMRKARREFLIMKGAAITVQACCRKYQTQRKYQQLRDSTVKLQSMLRSHLVRRKFVKLKQSSLIIQKHWRSYMEMKKVHQNYLIQKGAALTIQACFRGYKVRKEYTKKMSGVVRLQSAIRRFLCQKRYTELRSAVVGVQRLFRRKMLVTQIREEFLIMKGAAITIQAHYRRHLQQRDYKQKKLAVVKLQACLRMKTQRKSFQAMKIAAIKIQKWFRKEVLRMKVREEYLKKRSSVITLQRAVRLHIARKKADVLKRSVVCIQAQVRKVIAMQKFQKLKKSTLLLQRRYRAKIQGRLARQQYHSMRKAAITIQACVRRKQVQKLMAAQQECAKRIQCWYRSRKQQRAYMALRQAVVVCQKAYRNKRLGQTERNRYIVTIRSVRRIQAMYRGHKTRCMYQRMKQAIVKIQSSFRGFLERVRIRRLHEAAIVIQRSYRAHRHNVMVKLQQAERLAYLSRFAQTVRFHMSAMVIQQCYRKYLSLCRAEEQLQKILVLQNWFRGRICRMRFLKLKKSILTIQSAALQWLKSQGEKKRQHAAVVIQAVWRGRQVRMKNKSKKLEAVRKRVVEAQRSATEDKKLGNRTESALDYLLKYKQLSQILEALVHLDVATRLSPACCERMVEVNAVGVIYTLISSCNRSQPHMEIIKLAVSILLNLAKYDKTLPYVFVEGSLDILLDLMQIYREKGVIFNRTCTLVGILGIDNHRRMVMLSQPRVKERIQSLYNLSARKYQLQENQQMRQAKLNASKMFNSTLPIRGTPHKPRKIRPAWVLHRDSLHNIDNPMQAINFVMDNLHIRPK